MFADLVIYQLRLGELTVDLCEVAFILSPCEVTSLSRLSAKLRNVLANC